MSQDRRVGAFVVLGMTGFLIGIGVCDHYFLKGVAAQARNPAEADLPEAISSINVDPVIHREIHRQIAHAFADQTRQKGLRLRIRDNLQLYLMLAAGGVVAGCLLAAFVTKLISSNLPEQA